MTTFNMDGPSEDLVREFDAHLTGKAGVKENFLAHSEEQEPLMETPPLTIEPLGGAGGSQ